jgi:hypothetical protein
MKETVSCRNEENIVFFFSLLVSEDVIIDSRTDPRSRISLLSLLTKVNNEQPSPSNERFSLISLVNVGDYKLI